MRTTAPRQALLGVLLLALVVLAAACGQKPGVHVEATRGPQAVGGSGGGLTGGELGAGDGGGTVDDGGSGPDGGAGGGLVGDSGATGDQSGGAGGAGGAGPTGGGGGNQPSGGGTGGPASGGGQAWGDTIVIGIHAPITGAAPLPSSFSAAAGVYADWINGKGGIHGRRVRIEVVDDEYQPATAVQRCRELVQQKNAFLLIGGGGTDQIQACARFAEQAGVPYLSAGVTEIGLRGLRGYFAVSMSYKAQGAYLANYIRRTWPDKADNAAMVYSDTPNFRDARDGFVAAMGDVHEVRLSRVPSGTELANAARELCTSGVEVAYPLMAPKDWLTLVGSQPCAIQWAGVGLTMGLNTVASTGCRSSGDKINGSTFFSPFPGVDRAAEMDQDFAEAVRGRNWDDVYVALFAVNEAVGELIRRAGPDLTRAGFVQSTANAKNVATGLNPVLSFSPQNHFGADTVHVLRLQCAGNSGQYVTTSTFAKF